MEPWCWVDGRLVPLGDPVLPADDQAFAAGRGVYTTTRVVQGRPRWAERHALRLARDAARLGLPGVAPGRVLRALHEAAAAAFPAADGVVRVQASVDARGGGHLAAVPRPLGPEPEHWRAVRAPFCHEGPTPWTGAKVSNHLLYAWAADHARAQGVEEALLLDRDGYLIEGARSSVAVVDAEGRLCLPDLARGGVAGMAREVLEARLPGIRVANLSGAGLARARELLALNAVRGARPVVALDGRPVGEGRPGPWAERLAQVLDRD